MYTYKLKILYIMHIISLYLVFDSNKTLVMMCSELEQIIDELNSKKNYYVGDYDICYIEFTNGDLIDTNSMLNNSILIDTIHNI